MKRDSEAREALSGGGTSEPSRDSYIELGRHFGVVDKATDSEADALESYSLWAPSHSGIAWNELLEIDRVVVLGEAGSGKTWELRKKAEKLHNAGQPAFFVRLDGLKDASLTQRWEEREQTAFRQWQRGKQRAAFFLDSVDESKFRRAADFHDALDVFVRDVGRANLARAHIVLSSRVSEWHPETDAAAVASRLGPSRHRTSRNKREDKTPALHVFQILPLNEAQVGKFAAGRAVADVPEFFAELHRANAWEFARRPVDVVDLITLWQREGRLGTLTELIEAGLESRLRETSERARTDPLTADQARKGAEALASAVTFCRNFNFRVPDDALIASGLNGRSGLGGDWNDAEYQSLLARPLFDAASFGLVRFHHRRTQEYLAACWIAERMRQGCPLRALRGLFFDLAGSRPVLRPSLAAAAAWLCSGEADFNVEMRSWVLDDAPAIHLRYGDPQRLSLSYKRQILAKLAAASQARKRMWFESDPATLVRLAAPELEPELAGYVADTRTAIDFRAQLLEMGRLAKLRELADAALAIVGSTTEPDDLKRYAIQIIEALDRDDLRSRLAAALTGLPAISDGISATVLRALFPTQADGGIVVVLLEKITRTSSGWDSRSEVSDLFAKKVAPADAGELLARVVALIEQEPSYPTGGRVTISQRHGWIAKHLGPLVKVMLRRPTLTPAEVEVVGAGLLMLEATRSDGTRQKSEVESFTQLAARHAAVRRRFFWRKIAWMRTHGETEATRWYHAFGYGSALGESAADIEWAIADTSNGSDADREVAMRLAVDRWAWSGRNAKTLRRIAAALQGNPMLETVFRAEVDTVQQKFKFRRWGRLRWHRDRAYGSGRRLWEHVVSWRDKLMEQFRLLRNARRMASGDLMHWLAGLAGDAQADRHQLAADDWSQLKKKRGGFVARAVRKGCKAAWREHKPYLPHERPRPDGIYDDVVVGLSGLGAAVADGEIDFATQSDADARLATRYAVNEINGFPPWFDTLAAAKPDAVHAVLAECIEAEWRTLPAPDRRSAVLNSIHYHSETGARLVADAVLGLLASSEPKTYATLELAIGLLLRQTSDVIARLTAEAARRFAPGSSPIPAGHIALWFSVWLQTDPAAAMAVLPGVLYCGNSAVMVMIAANLKGRDIGGIPVLPQAGFRTPAILRQLIPLVHEHVRFQDDLALSGTVTARHDAQEFRGSLLRLLASNDALEVVDIFGELAADPMMAPARDWILRLRDETIEQRAEVLPWTERDIPLFERGYEIDPRTEPELYAIVLNRLADVKHSVEQADQSRRNELPPDAYEWQFRRWLARRLTDESRDRYVVPEEAVVDQEDRPDIRLMKPGVGPVSLELKIAERDWTIAMLLERLENQLVGQYMRDHGARCGVFVIGTQNRAKRFELPGGGPLVSFERVIELLAARAKELVAARFGRIQLQVVAMDFTAPIEDQER